MFDIIILYQFCEAAEHEEEHWVEEEQNKSYQVDTAVHFLFVTTPKWFLSALSAPRLTSW